MSKFYLKELYILLLLIVSFSANSQITRIDTVKISSTKINIPKSESPTLYLYSIGVKAFSYEEFPKILNQTNADDFRKTTLSGVFVKINDNQISYRLAGNFYSKNISFKNACEDCEEAKGKLTDFSTVIGFEKNFLYGMLQPYFAFDFGYRRNSFKGEVTNATAQNYTNPYDVTTLKNGLILSPNFGLKINLLDHFTLSAESGIGLLYSYERQERIDQDANHARKFNEYNKWEFLLRPVSRLSLQYNFGQTY